MPLKDVEARRAYLREYQRKYRKLPRVAARLKAYHKRPEVQAKSRAWYHKPGNAEIAKKRQIVYLKRPEVKARRAARARTQEVRAKQRHYAQQPRNIEMKIKRSLIHQGKDPAIFPESYFQARVSLRKLKQEIRRHERESAAR